MKKLLVVLLALLVVSIAFSDKVVLEFWHAMGGGLGETLETLVENFNKENPDIEIKPIYVGNYGALNQKLLSTITAYNQGSKDGLPVIAQSYSNWTAKFLFSNVIQDLNGYILDNPQMKKVWDTQIYDVFKDMTMWGDKIYAIPFNKSTYVYYYNTDLFDLYGLETPKTYEEFMDVLNTLNEDIDGDGQIDQYGIGIRTTVDDFQTFLYGMNGRVLEYVGNGQYKIVLDKDITIKTLEMLHNIKANDLAIMQGGYLNDPFGSGQIAAYMGTIAGKKYVDRSSRGKHGWDWSYLPSVDGKPHSPIAGTDLIMFNWGTDAQKDAAWRFMKYWLDPITQAYWSINSGYVPVRKDIVETEQWKKYVANDEKPVIALNTLKNAVADPKPAAWYDIRKEFGSIFTNYLNDQFGAEEAYNRMITSLNTMLEETNELAK